MVAALCSRTRSVRELAFATAIATGGAEWTGTTVTGFAMATVVVVPGAVVVVDGGGVTVEGVSDSNRQPRTTVPRQSLWAKMPMPKVLACAWGE